MPAQLLDVARYRCGNDMLCSWAGSLACADGISVIAGTGSMAYGEYAGRTARAGGWGELIGDEGSAYWIAREGMNLFSRMSDGRAPRGPLYELVRARFGIAVDLDLCAQVYGEGASARSAFARFAPLVARSGRRRRCSSGRDLPSRRGRAGSVRACRAPVAAGSGRRRVAGLEHRRRIPERKPDAGCVSRCIERVRVRRSFISEPQYQPDIGAALYAAHLVGRRLTPRV